MDGEERSAGHSRPRALARVGGAAIALALLLVACSAAAPFSVSFAPSACACTHGPTVPPGALSEAEATAAALRVVPSASPAAWVVWASVQQNPFGSDPSEREPLVWMVRLQGDFDAPTCASADLYRLPKPSDPPCLDGERGLVVVLDIYTGELLGFSH